MRNRWQISPELKKLLVALLLIVALYALAIFTLRAIGLDNVHQFIQQLGVWAPIAFVILCTISMIFAPLSASSMFVTGGVLFGQQIGFLLSFVASVMGCCINFWISRKLGRKVAARFIGHSSLDNLDRFTERLNKHHSVLVLMVIMPISQDLISYAVGLTKVRFWQFFVALVVSGAVVVGAYIYFGSGILEALL
ncbi:MAG: VTT domain-containing protein [Leptolyngbyaceae cyanobacterium bins.302]|nr:VTT domain-containing protein [Leptolyngbyaceae cyanobacterium bins.302]